MERTTPNPVLRAARQSLQWPKIPKKRDGHLDGKVHLLIRIGALICNGISIGLLFYVKKKYGTHETLGFAAVSPAPVQCCLASLLKYPGWFRRRSRNHHYYPHTVLF
jgi:hypothetical protein